MIARSIDAAIASANSAVGYVKSCRVKFAIIETAHRAAG